MSLPWVSPRLVQVPASACLPSRRVRAGLQEEARDQGEYGERRQQLRRRVSPGLAWGLRSCSEAGALIQPSCQFHTQTLTYTHMAAAS